MKDLPESVAPYRETAVFDEATIPAGLRRAHTTKAGTWGLIEVLEGRLRLRFVESGEEHVLEAGERGVVAPGEPHEVSPVGPVKMRVVFCR
ncbi:MAG TPA: DUF1971 domain-containing protein [Polyangiaceae bacterium LLY-WYZ-15_(1-7)]|nr:DUF1971 domain-containing protein [Polyangiaceae bacterium LLY-WYZ-15_(1-7)]HJL05063.1 DUF1971 domain-containing protein [Polyangiaceae bacterium LLY-WYZ-15_(1-7)]HJL07859.1 DUF1971 domain-containing protein [Polyangiaceae bacterium LLY-WYZ-15_(1-7)]HJL33111.1 DUF1971 domain-containing protein [Polyangiaceae bacterium LLY-WYZ-15_(1-7)]HJL45289.1 DUF1971 domain-containing protein [Polyangiaceae bacterium LLY-WYZ-15_(1-7)]